VNVLAVLGVRSVGDPHRRPELVGVDVKLASSRCRSRDRRIHRPKDHAVAAFLLLVLSLVRTGIAVVVVVPAGRDHGQHAGTEDEGGVKFRATGKWLEIKKPATARRDRGVAGWELAD
jgi:hypothetical protein